MLSVVQYWRALRCRLLLVGLWAAVPLTAQTPAVTAFVHVTVIPMDSERVVPEQTVVVRGNQIVAMGPAAQVPVPAGAQQIDGRGRFLMPGLGDMHSHIQADDEQGLFLALANGVTTLRDMGSGSTLAVLRAARARGVLLPPRIYGIGRMGDCQGLELTLPDCLAKMKAAGVDMLKLYDDYGGPARLDSVLAAAAQVHLRVGGHAYPGPGVERALQIPYKSIEHLLGYASAVVGAPILGEGWGKDDDDSEAPSPSLDTMPWMQPGYRLDPERLRTLAETTRRVGAWTVPTLAVSEYVSAVGSLDLPHGLTRWREFTLEVARALHTAGAKFLLSDDLQNAPNPAGFVVHRELELLLQVGLTPYEALEAGTHNVARYLGTQDSAGTVAVGKWADLVLLDGNPLQDIHYTTAITGVMADGRWFSRADLDARLDRLEAQGCYLATVRRDARDHRGISVSSFNTVMTQSVSPCQQ